MEVDYVIVADESKKIVWDCVEDHGLKMNLSGLDHFVGDDAKYCAVLELMRLAEQPIGKGGRKTIKIDPEKGMAKRIAARRH